MKMAWVEEAKRKAVLKAIEPIRNGWIIGLGSGSTTAYAIPELARLTRLGKLEVSVVPTSHQIEQLAASHGLRILSLNEAYTIDYAIDGADQVEQGTLNMIKGGGGALLREKVVDSTARKLTIVVDETKLSTHLGGKQTVPLEVLPFAYKRVQTEVARMGARARLREGTGKVGPVVTDNGNFILDADFGRINKPRVLERRLSSVPGILETGLFLGMAECAFVGLKTGQVKLLNAT
jgi:ribose 5-phosphate isomerase A